MTGPYRAAPYREDPRQRQRVVSQDGELDALFDLSSLRFSGVVGPDESLSPPHARWSPDRSAVALLTSWVDGVGVVFSASGELLFQHDDLFDVGWGAGGEVLIALSGRAAEPGEAAEYPPYSHFVERWSWPVPVRQAAISVSSEGYARWLAVAPGGRHAVALWRDQCEWGFDVVALGEVLARDTSLRDGETNLNSEPAFSPSGSAIAVSATASYDWWLPAPEEPRNGVVDARYRARRRERDLRGAEGGVVCAGWVWVHQFEIPGLTRIPVEIDLPRGWGSDIDTTEDATPELASPRFIDERKLELALPDGSTRTVGI